LALLGAPLGRPAPERFPPCKLVASCCFKYVGRRHHGPEHTQNANCILPSSFGDSVRVMPRPRQSILHSCVGAFATLDIDQPADVAVSLLRTG
jgi:hypothetical protein